MFAIIIITFVLLALWMAEYFRHWRNLDSIPVRIHVNGSRGKSSVTRLIAAGLRAGGIKTLAKTTGSAPRIIDEKGLEIPVKRPHMVNINEQLRIVDFMRQRKPQALVIECMAVQPEYQFVSERRMIKSTVGVITNARMDHVREMGPTLKNIALSLCNSLPKKGIAFTSEKKMFPVMDKAAKRMGTKLQGIYDGVSPGEMRGFSYLEHPANVSLALKVCEQVGVDRTTALKGMYSAFPDIGAMKIIRVVFEDGHRVYFINALAANDPQSTYEIWKRVDEMFPDRKSLTVLLNTRADRFDRSIQLLEMLRLVPLDNLALIGQKLEQVNSNALRLKIPKSKITTIKTKVLEEIYDKLCSLASPEGLTLIFAIGNMGQGGLQVADYFRKKYKEIKDKSEGEEVSVTDSEQPLEQR